MKYRTIGKAAVALLLAAALLFSAVGCGPQAQTVPEASSSSAAAPEPADSPEEEDLPVGVIAETADTITYDDMLAGEVTIQKRPQRVVVMLNAVMELWYMAGGTAVARIEGEDNIPEEAKDLPTIGTMSTPSVEKIVSYEPDLVILVNTLTKNREIQPALQEAGIPNISVRYKDYQDFCDLFELFTHITDQPERLEALDDIQAQVDAEIEQVQGKPEQKVMILYATAKYVKAGVQDSVIGDMLNRLGAVNIIDAEAGKRAVHGGLQHGEGAGEQPGRPLHPDGKRRGEGGAERPGRDPEQSRMAGGAGCPGGPRLHRAARILHAQAKRPLSGGVCLLCGKALWRCILMAAIGSLRA